MIVPYLGEHTYPAWRKRCLCCPHKERSVLTDSEGNVKTRVNSRGETVPRYGRTGCHLRGGKRCLYHRCPLIYPVETDTKKYWRN